MRDSMVRFLGVLSVVLGVVGCVDSKGKTGGSFNSGVEPTTHLDALTPTEATTICTAAADHVRAFVERGQYQDFVCHLNALMASIGMGAEGRTACETAYDTCLNNLSVSVAPGEPCEAPVACTATVADLEQCLRDQTSANSSIDFPRCSEVNFTTLTADDVRAMLPDEPTSCSDLDDECPGASELVDPNVDVEGVNL